MKLKRIFGSLKNQNKENGAANYKTSHLLLGLLMIMIVGAGGYEIFNHFIKPRITKKVSILADTGPTNIFSGHIHFSTVINGQSLNEIAPPTTDAEWTFEKDHLDTVIASNHAEELYNRSQGDAIKTHLTKYMLIPSTENPLAANASNNANNYMIFTSSPNQAQINPSTYKNFQETKDMHDFCTGTGNMADGYPKPGLTETQFEDAFLHVSDDTVLNTIDKPILIKGFGNGTATERSQSRLMHNIYGGYFYVINQTGPCAQDYKSYIVYKTIHDPQPTINTDGSTNTTDPGVIYDGIFVDEMSTGAAAFMNQTVSGGHILEYKDSGDPNGRTREQIASDSNGDQFAKDEGQMMAQIKSIVTAKIGHDFLLTLNSANDLYTNDPVRAAAALAAGGVTTEQFSTDQQYEGMGRDWRNWQWALYAIQDGLYFNWAQMAPDQEITDPSYVASNYAGATSVKDVNDALVQDNTGVEARHDMVSLVDYLIVKDRNNHMVYAQKAWSCPKSDGSNPCYGFPLSSWWMKAREMNIGQPTADQYTATQTLSDTKGQTYILYRRDYDKGVVLSRGYAGYPYTTDWSVQSQPYVIDPTNHTAYRILYPDGNLSQKTYTSIALAAGEGVVLVPDGYNPMIGGVVAPPSTNAKISLTTGSTHSVGDTFSVTANLNANSNNVCATTINMTFPADKIAVQSITAGTVFTSSVESNIDNTAGTLTYSVGAPSCSTSSNTDLLTIQFKAISPGTGNINIGSATVVGGTDKTQMSPITADLTGTSVTVNGTVPTQTPPTTTLQITNGATKNSNGLYNQYPVIRLTATASGNATVSNIKYQIDTGTVQTVSGATADNITGINTDGNHTLIYYATDSNNNVENANTAIFNVKTTPAAKPVIDPYNQHTYNSSFDLKGEYASDVAKVFVKDLTPGGKNQNVESAANLLAGNKWDFPVDLSVTGTLTTPATFSFSVSSEDAAGNRNAATTVNIIRHKLGDINGDGVVGTGDLAGILGNWHNVIYYMSDLDGNGTCDIYDLGILMANWDEK